MNRFKKFLCNIFIIKDLPIKAIPMMMSISIALTMCYIAYVNKYKRYLTKFYDRAIGHASINGIDAPVRVHTFWLSLIILVVSFVVMNYVFKKIKCRLSSKLDIGFLSFESTVFFELGMLMLVNLIIFYNNVLRRQADALRLKLIVLLAVVIFMIGLHTFIKILDTKNIMQQNALGAALSFLFPVPLTYFVLLMTSFNSLTINVYTIKAFYVYVILYLTVRFLMGGIFKPTSMAYSLIPISFIMFSYIVGNEIQYTLTKYGMSFSPKVIAVAINTTLMIIGALIYIKKRTVTAENSAIHKMETVIVPVMLVSLVMFASHIQTNYYARFDWLHSGITIVPVQQLYQFGKIPYVDFWPNQKIPIGTILYTLFNGYNLMEPLLWTYMGDSIINVLICYFVLRQFISVRWSALLMCFTPIIYFSNTYYIVALLPLIYLRKMLKNRSIIDYAIFFGLALTVFVYQATAGKIAILASFVIICLTLTTKKNIVNAIKGVIIVSIIPIIVYFTLVTIRGESLSDRLILIKAMADIDIKVGSYTNFISSIRTPFEVIMYYGIFPLFCVIFIILVIRQISNNENMDNTAAYCYLFLSVACIVSSLRALARHSLNEGLQTDFYPLLFVLVPLVFTGNKAVRKAISVLVIGFFMITPYVFASLEYNLAPVGIKDFLFRRYVVGEDRVDTVNNPMYPYNLRKILNEKLNNDQTFIDIINAQLLYALTEREHPDLFSSAQIYYSEPPQEVYIRQFNKLYNQDRIPIIVFGMTDGWWDKIDGIPTQLNLFKLSEWIYTHYEPWIIVDGFKLWKAKNSTIKLDIAQIDKEEKFIMDVPLIIANGNYVNDLTFKQQENSVILECGTTDPHMIFPLLQEMNIPRQNDNKVQIKIEFLSSVSGVLQVFFDFYGFNETDSLRINIAVKNDISNVYLTVPRSELSNILKAVRIDPPDGAIFEIFSISIVESFEPDFTIEPHEQQNFNFIKLAYVWGNYDEKVNKHFPTELIRIADNISIKADESINFQLNPDFDKSNGNYIYLRINSLENGIVTVQYGNKIINTCTFDVVAGEYDYLVRISAQYNWMAEEQESIDILATVPMSIQRMSVLKGD